MKEVKKLFINNEVARIEVTENKTWFLVCKDDMCMSEVTYTEMKEFLKDISFVCIASWNDELRKNYIDFVQYFATL